MLTDVEKQAIELLSGLSYLPASRDKWCMRNLRDRLLYRPHEELTAFQKIKLWQLVHKYRRQHGRCPCVECFKASQPKGFNPYQQELFDEGTMR